MAVIFAGMTRPELDAAYDNRAAAADFPATMRDFQARSAALYRQWDARRDLAYGPAARQRYDRIGCGRADAPVFVFIHGGYWQATAKEDFAFCAAGPLGRGFDVVLAEYTLAPATTMTGIAAEIGMLLDHLAADPAGPGTAGRPLCLSGHSAGGHLAALHRAHPAVTAVLAISGLYDLEPIRLTRLNDALRLTGDEVAALSPIRRIGDGAPMVISVGAAELPELVRQSDDYAAACVAAGACVSLSHVAAADHFRVLDDLADPSGVQMTALAALPHSAAGIRPR